MKTEVIEIREGKPIEPAIRQAADVLAQGGLVGFPTETVYGLAACIDLPASLQRLAQIKQGRADKPYTLHIAARSAADQYVGHLSLLDRQFLRKAWPGPLTVIFELDAQQRQTVAANVPPAHVKALYHNHTIGIRLPDHPLAQDLLAAAPGPVVAPSANLPDQPPPTCAHDVLDTLDGKIELLLDCGPTKYARSSTVVKLGQQSFEILREGVLDAAALQRMRSVTILFVCTGNSCRSPMAEGLCRKLLAEKLSCTVDELPQKGYTVMSAGTMAYDGAEATVEAIEACQGFGVDINSHRARLLTTELVNRADFIFVMDGSHYRAVQTLAPQAIGRTALLVEQQDVTDPICMPLEFYQGVAERVERGVNQRLTKLL